MKRKFLNITLFVILNNINIYAQNYLKDVVGYMKAHSFAGHCLIQNEPNSIDYGINGVPKIDLELFTSNNEILIQKNKLPVIVPKQFINETIGIREITTGDTLFEQSFFVVSNLEECKVIMNTVLLKKSSNIIFNLTLSNQIIYGEPNLIILNYKELDLEKVHVKFTNGEISEFGEGYLIFIPKEEKFSELMFEYDGEIFAKSTFIVKGHISD